ncbi:MAG: nucleotidyltransferase [Chitinophagaceae bacterium]|nr:nucleotidyltransferase [Chitinophagaceae bacterium]
MKPTLVILAAGMASRYGSMKQVQAFGPSGETIMDYSIYDAIQAGFGKIIFIIREEFASAFESSFNKKLANKITVEYVYQDIQKFVADQPIATDRVKPWGTAHALLCCKGKINEPFAIINADDFYGADAFKMAFEFLTTQCNDKMYGILGYQLSNTLSENGSVSRGVCEVDEKGNLITINERTKIFEENNRIIYEVEEGKFELSTEAKVSMNYMCFAPNVIDLCEIEFQLFLEKNGKDLKSEFFLPSITNKYIQHNIGVVKVIPTAAKWFGVTYKEDAPAVKSSIEQMVNAGIYPNNLWA